MFDPSTISPNQLNDFRHAAENAWGDDTCHPNHIGAPQPSSGQCHVTSSWLQSHLGGHVGTKGGHYFWVSPEKSHVIDLTGDQYAYEAHEHAPLQDEEDEPWSLDPHQRTHRPGPVMYKRADHPLYKGFRIIPDIKNDRTERFKRRADAALRGERVSSYHQADLMGADPFPGTTPQMQEDQKDINAITLHDEPDHNPDSDLALHEYNFVLANGQLHVSPRHSHDQLSQHAGHDPSGDGPFAVGYAEVSRGHVSWSVESNIGLRGVQKALKDYSDTVGWKWDGMTDSQGKEVSDDFGPDKDMFYATRKDGHLILSAKPLPKGKRIRIKGKTAFAPSPELGDTKEAIAEWARDYGYKLAEYPGGGNFHDKMKTKENLDVFNRGDTDWEPEKINLDAPLEGNLHCGTCGQSFKSDDELRVHRRYEHEGVDYEIEDGKFPKVEDFDIPLGFGRSPIPNGGSTVARVASDGPWESGWGKGMVVDGQPMTWNTDRWGLPHHDEMIERYENANGPASSIGSEIVIHPSGYCTHAYGQASPQERENASIFHGRDGLKYVQDENRWQQLTDRWERNASDRHKTAIMVLDSHKEAARHPRFSLYASLFNYDHDEGIQFYGAYRHGQLVAYGAVRVPEDDAEPEVLMIDALEHRSGLGSAILSLMQKHFGGFYTHADSEGGERLMRRHGMANVKGRMWRWAAGSDPKDMIEEAIPFIYDIEGDKDNKMGKINIGYAGQKTQDIPGKFTPGGIVEGYYEPGGKVVLISFTNVPWTVRTFASLWYSKFPQMEITSVESEDQTGKSTKLASGTDQIGQYIRTLVGTDQAAEGATNALRQAGGKVYVVGGAVRDALQGKEPKDIDLMVAGVPPEKVSHILEALPGRVDLTGKRFGVYRYRTGGQEVEIALPRQDKYETSRRGEGVITVDHELPIEADLQRRDFTANSMAVDLDDGRLVDPYGGAADIENHTLRTTHPDSFREDPTRLVRALVAHGRFGLNPDERTRGEMEANGHMLQHESPDALNKVLDKLLSSGNPTSAIRLGHETGILKHLFPEVDDNWDFNQNNPHHNYPLGHHLMNVLDGVSKQTTDPDVRMAAMLHDIGKPASAWTDPDTGFNHYYEGREGQGADHETVGAHMAESRLRALNYPVARINRIRHLIQHHMFSAFSSGKGARKFIQRVGDDHADDLLTIRQADMTGKGQTPEEVAERTAVEKQRQLVDEARKSQAPTDLSNLSINGNDLIQLGLKPGPQIGTVLRQLLDDVVNQPSLNQRDTLLQRAQTYVNAQPNI